VSNGIGGAFPSQREAADLDISARFSLTARHTITSNPKTMSHFCFFELTCVPRISLDSTAENLDGPWIANQLARKTNPTWHVETEQPLRRFTLDLMPHKTRKRDGLEKFL